MEQQKNEVTFYEKGDTINMYNYFDALNVKSPIERGIMTTEYDDTIQITGNIASIVIMEDKIKLSYSVTFTSIDGTEKYEASVNVNRDVNSY